MSMHIVINAGHPDSYSRELDRRVAASEMPYGYDHDGPPADTGDYNPKKYEEKNR